MGCTASTTDNNNSSAKTTNPTINTSFPQQKNYNDQTNLHNHQNTADALDNDNSYQDLEGEEDEEEQKQEKAALIIQASYKGYKTRKEFKQKKKSKENTMKEEESDAKPSEEKAATTIQAGFKGYKVRKEIKKQKSESSEDGSPAKGGDKDSVTDEIADIDLNDPEVEKAATKIQATFRGYKKRREPKQE